MSHEAFPLTSSRVSPREDARDLLTRLYREIGISAVAAALHVSAQSPERPRPSVKDIPAILRSEDKAA